LHNGHKGNIARNKKNDKEKLASLLHLHKKSDIPIAPAAAAAQGLCKEAHADLLCRVMVLA
jgi:hypothetical protein